MDDLAINKQKTALVVIDLQKGIAMMETKPHSSKTVIDNAAKLAGAFRKNGMPVMLVHVVSSDKERIQVLADASWTPRPGMMGADFSDFVPELAKAESDIIITKKQWGAFYGTDLELQLRRRGMDTIVLCGISTNHGVESTARFAYEYGFQQIFAEDAMAGPSEEAHRISLEITFKRMGRVRSTEEILGSLG